MTQAAFQGIGSHAKVTTYASAHAPASPKRPPAGASNQFLLTKLRIGATNDPLEHEADRVADAVVAGAPLPAVGTAPAAVQSKCAECEAEAETIQREAIEEEDETIRAKAEAGGSAKVGAEQAASAVASGGTPLSSDVRSYFEPRFGRDLSSIRIHRDGPAPRAAHGINARAYTLGRNIAFASGAYAPATHEGRRLIAHELAHVVQQDAAPSPPIRRQAAPGGAPETAPAGPAPAGSAPAGGATTPPEKLRFDILGADNPLADFLANTARVSPDPDLRVASISDLIKQLEGKAAGSSRCIDHIRIFNHGMPGWQLIAGSGGKKVSVDGGKPGKLAQTGFDIEWLYKEGNQADLVRLRSLFCCGGKMEWLGCGVAGVTAEGGTRTEAELAERRKIAGGTYSDRYADEADARAHHARLSNATLGKVTVRTWADATCASIRAATNFTLFPPKHDPSNLYYVSNGQFVEFAPTAAGACTCDPATNRAHGGWKQPVDYGDPKWQADLKIYLDELKPKTGKPNPANIQKAITALIDDIRSTLTVPSGFSFGPSRYPWIDGASDDPRWTGYTYKHLVFAYPNDPWNWIAINRMAIQSTPGFTRTVLDHELMHASDLKEAAFVYRMEKGPPPPAPAGADKPTYRPAKGDPYGDYILDFHNFYTSSPWETPHVDLYTASVAQNFAHLTGSEKAEWAGAMFSAVPADFPRDEALSSEALIGSIFTNMLPNEASLRKKIAENLTKQTLDFIDHKDFGRAQTLLDHFTPVWEFDLAAFGRMWGNLVEEKKGEMQSGHK